MQLSKGNFCTSKGKQAGKLSGWRLRRFSSHSGQVSTAAPLIGGTYFRRGWHGPSPTSGCSALVAIASAPRWAASRAKAGAVRSHPEQKPDPRRQVSLVAVAGPAL